MLTPYVANHLLVSNCKLQKNLILPGPVLELSLNANLHLSCPLPEIIIGAALQIGDPDHGIPLKKLRLEGYGYYIDPELAGRGALDAIN